MATNNACNYKPTQYTVQVGGASGTLANVGPGSSGQVLQSGGASANPAYSTATYPSTAGTSGNVLTSDGTNWVSQAPATSSGGFYTFTTSNIATPADATLYYCPPFGAITSTNSFASKIYIPSTGTINKVYGVVHVGTILGSSETCDLQVSKNGGAGTNCGTMVFTATDTNFSATSVGFSVTAGDYIQFSFTSPSWATNPTNVSVGISFIVS